MRSRPRGRSFAPMTAVKSRCSRCGMDKASDQFSARSRSDRRPRTRCKQCCNSYQRTRPPRQVDPVAHAKSVAKWLETNPGWSTEYQRNHYRANRVRINERRKVWSAENGNKFLEYRNRRRALQAEAAGSHTVDEFVRLCVQFGGKCLRCNDPCSNLTQDHIVPLSLGGTDWIWNIQPLCRGCNASKGATVEDYRC